MGSFCEFLKDLKSKHARTEVSWFRSFKVQMQLSDRSGGKVRRNLGLPNSLGLANDHERKYSFYFTTLLLL